MCIYFVFVCVGVWSFHHIHCCLLCFSFFFYATWFMVCCWWKWFSVVSRYLPDMLLLLFKGTIDPIFLLHHFKPTPAPPTSGCHSAVYESIFGILFNLTFSFISLPTHSHLLWFRNQQILFKNMKYRLYSKISFFSRFFFLFFMWN